MRVWNALLKLDSVIFTICLSTTCLTERYRSMRFTAINKVSLRRRYFMCTLQCVKIIFSMSHAAMCLHKPINKNRPHLGIDLTLLCQVVRPQLKVLQRQNWSNDSMPSANLRTLMMLSATPRLKSAFDGRHVGVYVFDILCHVLRVLHTISSNPFHTMIKLRGKASPNGCHPQPALDHPPLLHPHKQLAHQTDTVYKAQHPRWSMKSPQAGRTKRACSRCSRTCASTNLKALLVRT